jgi:hypothetical protein
MARETSPVTGLKQMHASSQTFCHRILFYVSQSCHGQRILETFDFTWQGNQPLSKPPDTQEPKTQETGDSLVPSEILIG